MQSRAVDTWKRKYEDQTLYLLYSSWWIRRCVQRVKGRVSDQKLCFYAKRTTKLAYISSLVSDVSLWRHMDVCRVEKEMLQSVPQVSASVLQGSSLQPISVVSSPCFEDYYTTAALLALPVPANPYHSDSFRICICTHRAIEVNRMCWTGFSVGIGSYLSEMHLVYHEKHWLHIKARTKGHCFHIVLKPALVK